MGDNRYTGTFHGRDTSYIHFYKVFVNLSFALPPLCASILHIVTTYSWRSLWVGGWLGTPWITAICPQHWKIMLPPAQNGAVLMPNEGLILIGLHSKAWELLPTPHLCVSSAPFPSSCATPSPGKGGKLGVFSDIKLKIGTRPAPCSKKI